MYDVIIVGARCSGAAAALRFARSGRSVLVLEKGARGSDTLSTHVLVASAIPQIESLGLLEAVLATGAPPVRTSLVQFNGQSYPRPVQGKHGFMLSVRRTVLDPILIAEAERAGAVFRFGSRVDDLLWEGERVVGVQGYAAGKQFSVAAGLVIGGDGRHSVVARRAGAREYHAVESKSAAIYAYFRGVGPTPFGADVLQYACGPSCDILCCPCDGNLHVVLLCVEPQELRTLSNSDSAYQARLLSVPAFAPRLADATRVSRLYKVSARELRGYFREPYGPGWALVGDAGYYAHPAAANGIHDALRSAELLHEHVERAWATGGQAETYLDHYQQIRDSENLDGFYFSYRLGYINAFKDPEFAAAVIGRRE